jgi:xanthosine utilization system XapX-like protein
LKSYGSTIIKRKTLIRVKSPAPPIVALLGLLGMVLGEQFGTWFHTKKLDVSHAASVCLVGERYDRQLDNPPSRIARYDSSSVFAEHIALTDEQTLGFTAKRNGGNCYEDTNANE